MELRIVENITSGKAVEVTLSSGAALCGQNAEWILEDPGSPSVAFPKFTSFNFIDLSAQTSTGATVGLDGATFSYIDQSNQILCEATEINNGELSVTSAGN